MSISIFFLILFNCLQGLKYDYVRESSFAEENNIRGKVSSFTQKQFFNPDTLSKKIANMQVYLLDDDGNMIEKRHSGGDYKVILIDSVKRIPGGRIHTTDNYAGIRIMKITTTISTTQNTLRKLSYSFNDFYEDCLLTFDTSGNIIEIQKFDEKNILIEKETYKYDNRGNRNEEFHFNLSINKTEPLIKIVFTFDPFGNKISENHFSLRTGHKLHDPQYKWTYKYDKHGNWVTKFHFENDSSKPYMREERSFVYK